MNAITLAIINMLQTLRTVVNANLAKYTVIPAFSATFTEVTDRLTQIETLKATSVENTKARTEANLALRLDLCKKTETVAKHVSAYASSINDIALKALMNVKVYKLKPRQVGVLTSACQNVHTQANAVKVAAAPFGLTQAKLDELQALIDAYTADAPKVRQERGEIGTSKKDIDKLANECLDRLEGQLDPMVETLEDTDPTAVELWRSARVVVDPPSTPTQLKVKVFTLEGETFVPMVDIPFIASNGKDYTLITDALGEAQKKPIPFGIYDLKCNVAGYQPFLLKKYKMVRGKINKVDIVLVPVV